MIDIVNLQCGMLDGCKGGFLGMPCKFRHGRELPSKRKQIL